MPDLSLLKDVEKLPLGVDKLHPDERAYVLAEYNLNLPPAFRGFRRYRIITVNRDDKLIAFKKDMGPAELFVTPEFRILGLWEYSVAELWEMADRNQENMYWVNKTVELQGESTLIKRVIEQAEANKLILENKSTFGPGIKVQRNVISKTMLEDIKYKESHGKRNR